MLQIIKNLGLFIIRTFIIITSILISGCDNELTDEEATSALIGSYELVVDNKQHLANRNLIKRLDLEHDRIKLYKDKKFVQNCVYGNGESYSSVSQWDFRNGHFSIDKYKDCAGIWPVDFPNEQYGAHLIVEFSNPPVILLSSELNIYYTKIKNTKLR